MALRDRSLITSWEGGGEGFRRGVQFSKRLNFEGKFFENAQNVRGSKY